MTDQFKKFFSKKKSDFKFKKAGPGYKLTDTTSSTSAVKKEPPRVEKRGEQTDAEKAAAAAALARLGGSTKQSGLLKTSHNSIIAQARKQLEQERQEEQARNQQPASPGLERRDPVVTTLEAAPVLAANGVYFKCPLIGEEILSREEWIERIREFLMSSLEDESESGLTACLMIRSLNTECDKVNQCVETIIKYLKNILDHPSEEKYQKIRLSNKIFQERVSTIEGSMEFLRAAGFKESEIEGEKYLVYNAGSGAMELDVLIDALGSCEPISLELDRNTRVLNAASALATSSVSLPRDFFQRSKDEIKREATERAEQVQLELSLRTKAMRARDEELKRDVRHYKYCIVRVKFPDSLILQGTFSVSESYSAVLEFVRECIYSSLSGFTLSCPGYKLGEADESKSLLELHLVPAAIFYFNCGAATLGAGRPIVSEAESLYLKPEVTVLLSDQ